jgi:phage terminase large subunit
MLNEAKAHGRIGKVAADPLLPLRAFHDIGGSGANADAYTIWIVQWVGQEIVTGFVGAVWLGAKVMLGK